MPSEAPQDPSSALQKNIRYWIDGWNKLGLQRTHTVPRVPAYLMLAFSLPVGLTMNGLVRMAAGTENPGLWVTLPAGYVAGLNRLTEEPLGTGLSDSFWIGMAVLLPLWLIVRGLVRLGVLVSRSLRP